MKYLTSRKQKVARKSQAKAEKRIKPDRPHDYYDSIRKKLNCIPFNQNSVDSLFNYNENLRKSAPQLKNGKFTFFGRFLKCCPRYGCLSSSSENPFNLSYRHVLLGILTISHPFEYMGVHFLYKMRDLKQCLIDLLRTGGLSAGEKHSSRTAPITSRSPPKLKKLYEYTAADCNAAFLRKYNNIANSHTGGNSNNAIIYFNENLTMTSKYDVHHFPLGRHPSCSMGAFYRSDDSVSPQSSNSDNHTTDDSESGRYDYSSDDCDTLIECCSHDTINSSKVNGLQANNEIEAQLDSFCTLCTSSFSYNKCCRYCDSSHCGSKCNSETSSLANSKSQQRNVTKHRKSFKSR